MSVVTSMSVEMMDLPEESRETPLDPADALDVSLMSRVGEGDMGAFEQLVERHQGAVVGTVAKMLGPKRSVVDAEDIAQQVFIRIWKHAKRYEPTAKFTTWMFTIARNLVFNESRRWQRRAEVSSEEREDHSHLELVADPFQQPDQEVLESELQRAVDAAIDRLPENQKAAVILRRYENMAYEDIAQVLGLSMPAVKSQLFRARATLKELLAGYLDRD